MVSPHVAAPRRAIISRQISSNDFCGARLKTAPASAVGRVRVSAGALPAPTKEKIVNFSERGFLSDQRWRDFRGVGDDSNDAGMPARCSG
jgi:hypothetical protein